MGQIPGNSKVDSQLCRCKCLKEARGDEGALSEHGRRLTTPHSFCRSIAVLHFDHEGRYRVRWFEGDTSAPLAKKRRASGPQGGTQTFLGEALWT